MLHPGIQWHNRSLGCPMTEWPTPSKEAPFSYTNCNEPTVAAYKPRAQADLPLWARRLHATTSSLAPGLRGGITFRAVEGRGAERRADRINLACARMVVGAVNRLAKRAASTDLPGSDVQLMVAGLWAGGSTLTMMLMDESLKRAMLRSLLALRLKVRSDWIARCGIVLSIFRFGWWMVWIDRSLQPSSRPPPAHQLRSTNTPLHCRLR